MRLDRDLLKVFQRERDLDSYLYYGEQTAHLILPDVRVGDVLEYSYTLKGANPVFQGRYADTYKTGWSVPVQQSYLSILSRPDLPLYQSAEGGAQPLTKTRQGELVRYQQQQTNLPEYTPEQDTPEWHLSYPYLFVSEYQNWQCCSQCGMMKN